MLFNQQNFAAYSVSLGLLPHSLEQNRKLRAAVFSLPKPWGVVLDGELHSQCSGYFIVAVLSTVHSCYNLFSVPWPRSGVKCQPRCQPEQTGSGAATNEGCSLIQSGGFIKALRHKGNYLLVLGCVCVCPAFSGGYKLGLWNVHVCGK